MAHPEESSRSICTRRWGRTHHIDVETDLTAAIGMCSWTDVRKDKTHPSSMAVDPRRHSRQSRAFEIGEEHRERSRHGNQRPRRTDTSALVAEAAGQATQCRRLLGLIATANGGSVVEAQVDGDEGTILVAFVTCVMWNALRQVRLFNTGSSVEDC